MTSNRVAFVAEYEDGRTVEFSIDRWTLSLGEYVPRFIARERQAEGELPPGKIKEVKPRNPPYRPARGRDGVR